MTIKELQDNAYKNACEKGFHDKETNLGESLMLVVSELGEALEADRYDHYAGKHPIELFNSMKVDKDQVELFELFIKDTVEDELADAVIRIADLCGALDIDLEAHIKLKMAYNSTRRALHGKRY